MTSGENSIGRGRAAVLLLVGLLGLAAFAPAAALAGSISGTVTDAVTHEPIEGLEVCAYPSSAEEEVWFCEDTDSNGEYTIAELEADEYGVEFWGRPLNYIPQYYDGQTDWGERNEVLVGTDPVTGIDAEMVEGGGIEGEVDRAADGVPVEAALVCAWTISGEEFGGCAETDSSGEYAIQGMAEGEYEVEFWAAEQDLLTQYYDHKDHWWEANPVTVTLGAVTPGIDADLFAAARVEGQVRLAKDGSPLSEVEVCAWSTDLEVGGGRCGLTGGDGRYVVTGLAGDDYKVEFWSYESELGQYWDHKASWDEANVLSLAAGSSTTAIDADLGPGPVAPPVVATPPPPAFPPLATKPRPKHCKKGFRKKRVHGKVRCVKRKKRRHHLRHAHGRPAADRAAFRLGR